MTPNPYHVVQTSSEAKAAYKRSGYNISAFKQRSLQRGAELDARAARLGEKEERRKFLKRQREERERKEREARERNGVGLATQMAGYSHTQAELKRGMEAFLGYSKKKAEEKKIQEAKDAELHRNLEVIAEELAREPWDEDDELPDLGMIDGSGADVWIDDDLDDDTLIEAHDLALSDPIEESLTKSTTKLAAVVNVPTPTKVIAQKSLKRQSPKEDPGYIRLHGPIDKTIEAALDEIPGPLIELLSKDMPKEPTIWDPALSLLHKLNPHGLPPHRLRVKVGCVVVLLQDMNNSIRSSTSQHLQILRMDKERLECLVLDGQLEGTKTFLTRTVFPACHHNDRRYPFQRLQFPIRVAKDHEPVKLKEVRPSSFKMPSVTREATQTPTTLFKKPEPKIPKPETKLQSNPAFKLPGLPASKANPVTPPLPLELDEWADFLESGTQIARELSEESQPQPTPQTIPPHPPNSASQPSGRNSNPSLPDLPNRPRKPLEPKPPTNHYPWKQGRNNTSTGTKPSPSGPDPTPSSKPSPAPSGVPPTRHLKRKSSEPDDTTSAPAAPRKRTAMEPLRPIFISNVIVTAAGPIKGVKPPVSSFEEFRLSTQDVTSLFDNDFDEFPW